MGTARQKWQTAKGRVHSKDLETLLQGKEKFGGTLDLAENMMVDLESKLKGLLRDAGKFDTTATAVANAARRYNAVLVESATRRHQGAEGVAPTDARDLIEGLKASLKQAKRIHKARLENFEEVHTVSADIERVLRTDMIR